MKKIYLLITVCFIAISSWGQLMYEPFDYPAHATNGLAAQSGGVWLRLNSGDSMLVDNGSLSYTGLPASIGNKIKFDGAGIENYSSFAVQTTGSVYYSFILNVSSLGTLGTTGGYFIGLIQAATTTSYGGTVWTRQSTTAGKYNVGVSTRSNSAPVWLAADLDPGTSYFIVAAYEIITGTGNDVAKIWLNATAGSAEPAPGATSVVGTDLGAAGIGRILLRQDNATNTPFIEVDEIRVGTTWADVTPGSAVPVLSISSPLTAFGDICINTTAGPNSFTMSGSNLTTANVTVGALPGYTYSTTSGGTYATSLSLTQPGGTYNQDIFVKFDPVAVQSYSGNIPVAGGGVSSPVNVAASGAGVNSMPTLTTGGATAITLTSATAAGTITSIGCSPVTAYGIEYSTVNGFVNGTGTQVSSTNLAGGDFSSDLTGLSNGTPYYYKAYATNAGGTAYGTQESFTTLTPNPSISTGTLADFGNVCTGATGGPNSFTITGSNLTTANISVAALSGYSYATAVGGPYTTTLNLTQPGGTYSQQIFVRFEPTAVQSYNGNIVITGGGIAAPVNVAATGAGVNTSATVTTGPATSITQTTATAAGSVTAIGCSAVTTYGIEYSLTNGFTPGTGTQTASTNIAAGNFTSSLTGLVAATTYYYRAYANNSGGISYGAQLSFTTVAPQLTASTLVAFGSACTNVTSGAASFTLTGVGLTNANVQVGPLTGYSFSTTSGGTYTPSITITQPGGAFSQEVFVKFTPVAVQSYNGNIPVTGGGIIGTLNVAASGSGENTQATVVTGATSDLSTQSVVLNGSITANGCSNISAYGFEYSGVPGFANGTGTSVPATNLAGGSFSATVNGLVQGATYYYKAWATNGGGTSYGQQQSFTLPSIADGFRIFPVPVQRGTDMHLTVDDLKPGYYGLLLFNSDGKLVFQKDMNVQANFINQFITLPASLQAGVYRVRLVDYQSILFTRSIIIL